MNNNTINSIAWEPDPAEWLTNHRLEMVESVERSVGSLLREAKVWEKVIRQLIKTEIAASEALVSVQQGKSNSDDLDVQSQCHQWANRTWGHLLESLFLSQKDGLDRAICGLIRMRDKHLVQEIYHRIKADEVDFRIAALEFGEGQERFAGGLLPLQEIRKMPLGIGPLLRKMQVGELRGPMKLGSGYCLIRLFEYQEGVFNDSIKHQLLEERFELWLDATMEYIQCEDNKISVAKVLEVGGN